MKKIFWTVTILMYVLACKSISSQKGISQSKQKRIGIIEDTWIRTKIDSAMQKNNIPALAVGIIINGKLSAVEGFGHLNRESTIKVDGNTLFQIGSDTKKFTGIIVNNLVSEGKLSLDEPITTYLENVLTDEGKRKVSGITLRILLHHTSGIPTREPSNKRIDGNPMLIEMTENDIINDINAMKLDFEPKAKFGYSNFGYAVVGFICEKISGQLYADLVKKYITDIYNMPNTVVFPNQKQSQWIAQPYRKDNRNIKSAPWKMGKMTPAGGIYSNIHDISNLVLAQIRAYQKFNENGNKSDPLILTENSDTDKAHYGFGLSKVIDESGIRYGHGGDLDGYASGYVFNPKENLGLIMLTSSGGRWFGNLEKEIRIYLMENNKHL